MKFYNLSKEVILITFDINSCFKAKFIYYFLLYTWEERIGLVKILDFRFSMDLHVLRCPKQDLTIFRKCLLSICMSVYKILWTLYLKNLCTEIDETLYSVVPLHNLALIRFWCISLKKLCCSKFLISLTQWHRQNCVQLYLIPFILS